MAVTGTDIETAARWLNEDDVVAIPTETVYGLAGNALSVRAATRIFTVKQRPSFDPLIVHMADANTLAKLASEIPQAAWDLAEECWPGPMTLLLNRQPIIPDLVVSGLPRGGFRCPDHSMTLELLRMLPFPLAAPSANPFGYVSPTTARHVADQLGDKIPYILDGGPCRVGLESTIVGWEEGDAVIYRQGGIPADRIKKITGKVRINERSTSHPQAPGQLLSHYAPRKRVLTGNIGDLLQLSEHLRCGVLRFSAGQEYPSAVITRTLSDSGSTEEAAQHLFSHLRELDSAEIDVILAEFAPEAGLGPAINDRLKRASA